MGLTGIMAKAVRSVPGISQSDEAGEKTEKLILEDPGPRPKIPELVLHLNLPESQPMERFGSCEPGKGPDCGARRPCWEEGPSGIRAKKREGEVSDKYQSEQRRCTTWPKPPPPPLSLWGASSIASTATAENLLADAGELRDRQLNEAIAELFAAVSAAEGGPWEGTPDLTEEALKDWMCDQDDGAEELKERITRKQRDMVRLAEEEEEEETPPRSQGSATTAATPQEARITSAGQQEVAWYQGERVSYQQVRQNGQVWGEQQGAELWQWRQVLELRETKVSRVQDLLAMIQREMGEIRDTVWRLEREKEDLGEQIIKIRESFDELRSFKDCRQDAMRLEEATTHGPRIPGSREELELKVAEANKKV